MALAETLQAIDGLKNNKRPGPDSLPSEILKKGGYLLHRRLHQMILATWATETVPQEWKDANIITIYKKKSDKSICGNSRGISLLAAVGKVLARIVFFRLANHIAESVLPETQCGFRKDRRTTGMIIAARHSKHGTPLGSPSKVWGPPNFS